MKAMLIYSSLTGRSNFLRSLEYIKNKLTNKFTTLTMVKTSTLEEFKNKCIEACKEYDYLLFVGGDGTVNNVINFIAKEEKKPILGYIPGGTTNDFAHNFSLSRRIKKAIKNIIYGEPSYFDVCEVNGNYFSYVLACGAFSEISYTAKRNVKKKIGSLAYYIMAVKDAFIPRKVEGTLIANNKTYNVKTPFLLVLNGNHVGGFYVNLKNKINDGKFTIFITKPGIFNGLLHYALFKARTLKITTDHFTFSFKERSELWCLDGEEKELDNVEVKCIRNFAKIIVPHRVAKKISKQHDIN